MKQVIEELLKRYYRIRMILPRTILTESKGRVTINVYDDVAPNLWQMYEEGTMNPNTGVAKLNIKRAYTIQEDERNRIAMQVFEITKMVMKQLSTDKNVTKEWNEKYGDLAPKGNEGHEKLIKYSLGALFHCKILTPYEYDLTEPAFDEAGQLLYVKLMPKEKTDETTEALGHLMPQGVK